MSTARARPRTARRVTDITESLPPGLHVKAAGTHLARLFAAEFLARLRARQQAAVAAHKGAA